MVCATNNASKFCLELTVNKVLMVLLCNLIGYVRGILRGKCLEVNIDKYDEEKYYIFLFFIIKQTYSHLSFSTWFTSYTLVQTCIWTAKINKKNNKRSISGDHVILFYP